MARLSSNKNQKAPVQQKKGKRKSTKGQKSAWGLYSLAILAMCFLIYTAYSYINLNKDQKQDHDPKQTVKVEVQSQKNNTIAKEIYFADIKLTGLSREDFTGKLKEKSGEILAQKKVKLVNEKSDKQPDLSVKDFGYSLDADKIYSNALRLSDLLKKEKGKADEAGFLARFALAEDEAKAAPTTIAKLADHKGEKYYLYPTYQTNDQVFDQAMKDLVQNFSKNPEGGQGAIKFNLANLSFDIPAAVEGYTLDQKSLAETIRKRVEDNQLDQDIPMPFKENETPAEAAELKNKLGYVSSGYTQFVTYDPPRDANVKRVSDLLTGLVIQPGEIFSYNEKVGPITEANGYTYGYVIGPDGQTVKGIGGGICQASSTLYNAVVRADLQIIERNNHTVPSAYIEKGKDAMVSDWSDFKFKNNTDYPIAIVGTCVATQYIQFDIYGRKLDPGVTIDLVPTFTGEEQPKESKRVKNDALQPGEEVVKREPIVGSYWSTDKVYYKDGVEFKREHLNKSHYWAYQGLIEVGPENTTEPSGLQPIESTADSASENMRELFPFLP